MKTLAILGMEAWKQAVLHGTLMLLPPPVATSPDGLSVGILLVLVETVGNQAGVCVVTVAVAVKEIRDAKELTEGFSAVSSKSHNVGLARVETHSGCQFWLGSWHVERALPAPGRGRRL